MKRQITAKQRKLVEKLKAHIRANAKYYDQNKVAEKMAPEECGTTCCMAGHLVALKPNFKKYDLQDFGFGLFADYYLTTDRHKYDIMSAAERMLGGDTSVLFDSSSSWPGKFQMAYDAATSNRQRAAVACRVLDAWVKNGGTLENEDYE